jgi:hypothetical protein
MVVQRRQARQLETKKKKQQLAKAKIQKEVTAQLKKDLITATPKPEVRSKVLQASKRVVVVVESDIEYKEVVEPRI